MEERVVDPWSPETQMKNDEGILYDHVVVTGDYDTFGSIQGFLDSPENGIGDRDDLLQYFDIIVITRELMELPGREIPDWNNFTPISHPNGKWDLESWLTRTDYLLIKDFDKMVIDSRGGIRAFEWYADLTYTVPPSELVFDYKYVKSSLDTLSGVFGIREIGGQEMGTDYIEASSYRILYSHEAGISDNYFSAGDTVNFWEEGNSYGSYLPGYKRDVSNGIIYNNYINSETAYHKSFVLEYSTH